MVWSESEGCTGSSDRFAQPDVQLERKARHFSNQAPNRVLTRSFDFCGTFHVGRTCTYDHRRKQYAVNTGAQGVADHAKLNHILWPELCQKPEHCDPAQWSPNSAALRFPQFTSSQAGAALGQSRLQLGPTYPRPKPKTTAAPRTPYWPFW